MFRRTAVVAALTMMVIGLCGCNSSELPEAITTMTHGAITAQLKGVEVYSEKNAPSPGLAAGVVVVFTDESGQIIPENCSFGCGCTIQDNLGNTYTSSHIQLFDGKQPNQSRVIYGLEQPLDLDAQYFNVDISLLQEEINRTIHFADLRSGDSFTAVTLGNVTLDALQVKGGQTEAVLTVKVADVSVFFGTNILTVNGRSYRSSKMAASALPDKLVYWLHFPVEVKNGDNVELQFEYRVSDKKVLDFHFVYLK